MLSFPAGRTGDGRAAALERVGLAGRGESRADALSGGQQQRVAIARALMQQPELILADEPVASLDPALRHSVMRHIEALNRDEGMTVVCSLHDIDLVDALRDQAGRPARRRARVAGRCRRISAETTFKEIYGQDAEPASNSGF